MGLHVEQLAILQYVLDFQIYPAGGSCIACTLTTYVPYIVPQKQSLYLKSEAALMDHSIPVLTVYTCRSCIRCNAGLTAGTVYIHCIYATKNFDVTIYEFTHKSYRWFTEYEEMKMFRAGTSSSWLQHNCCTVSVNYLNKWSPPLS